MVKMVILTQGGLAHELMAAAGQILGKPCSFIPVELAWEDSFEVARDRTVAALSAVAEDEEVLVLTDMYGGTPYNVAKSLKDSRPVEVVTGVNLPMVVRLGCPDTARMGARELAAWIREKARRSICVADDGEGPSTPGFPKPADSHA